MLEGIADAGPDEARREREEIIAKLPQSDATDTVFASLGFATDVIGVGLNRFEAAWWGKPFNLLADSFSAMWASMQLSRAAKRNLDVVMTDLSHLDDKTRKRILFIYNFDHQISRIAMAISIAGVAASVAQVKGVQLAGAAEVGLKALKWTLFGLSLSDAAVGNAQALLEIGRRINDIKEWANRFDVGAAIRAIEMYKGFLATKEGKEATVTATAGLTNSAGANVDAVTSSILEVIPPHQLDEMLDFIRGIKQEASAIA
jgi:hypothetical protein